ncbi:MAG TPA: hypothetical protein VGT60_11960 [Candidatus Limnocylindria bacterium]|nr:hypothetical protein [Candidatus Limnocylindria bacterium]
MVFLLLAIAVIGAAVYFGRGLIGRPPTAADQIDRAAYQVVFLTTGQAFYGRLSIPDTDTYLLSDVYYPVTNDTGLRLLKRGTEVFGPRDPMVISGRQVLYFENLRDDSDIVVGIKAIKSGQGGSAPTTAPATAPVATATARPSATR